MQLGINVDHIATLRQARGTTYPDPVAGALLALSGGADFITVHLREDRRHIQEADVELLLKKLPVKLNLELAITPQMVDYACRVKPAECCLVPEKREELTTEGGLDVITHADAVAAAIQRLHEQGIRVSLFIDPDPQQVATAHRLGAGIVELHTGHYAELVEERGREESEQDLDEAVTNERQRLFSAASQAAALGMVVNAGHGLHSGNLESILDMPGLNELNIGHSVISSAVFVGLKAAVMDLLEIIESHSGIRG